MEQLCMLQLVTYLTLHCFLISTVESYSSALDTKRTIAQFSPYVSIFDAGHSSRYSVDELVPLIAKVATRFKKILIQLELTQVLKTGNLTLPETRDSDLWGAVAAAKYNCQPSTKQKIEVILYLDIYTYNSCLCFKRLKKPFEDFANEANKICNGTVTTILVYKLRFCNLPSVITCSVEETIAIDKNTLLFNRYKWGVGTSFQSYCNQTIRSANIYWDPAVVLLEYENDNDMQIDLTQCKSYNEALSKPVEFIKKIHWTDRQKDYKINMSNLVASWKSRISDLSKESYILIPAFDNPRASGGWWFLNYDPASTNTSAFVFKEKIQVAREIDSEEDPMNFDWLKEEIIINVNSTGILIKRDTLHTYVAQSGFCRVITYEGGYKLTDLHKDLSQNNSNCVSNSKVIFSSNNFKSTSDFDKDFTENNITLLMDLTKGFLYSVLNLTTLKHDNYYIKTMEYTKKLQDLKKSGAEYGYSFSIKICQQYSQLDDKSKEFLFALLRDSNSTMNIFVYNEDEHAVKTGARQMFTTRILLFEQCRKLVIKSGNNKSELGFAIQGYYRVDGFHRSLWALQNYVKYVKMMNKWGGEQINTWVYLGTLRDGEQDGGPVVGWITLDYSQTGFTTKQQDALKLSKLYYPKSTYPNVTRDNVETTSGLNTSRIVIVVCVVMAVCLLVIICSGYFIRLYYRKGELSREEMDMFFTGNDMSDLEADKVAYDHDKYEILDDAFSLDKSEPLGCGEFGMVFRGTVTTEDGKVTVAVKTTNLNTRHKTTLKGLLSETKVLAHVGKHANIIELLGANTSSLKDGNVYIFLELCQLGSLEGYLRAKISTESFCTEDANFDSPNVGKGYISMNELTRHSLKKTVSDDLYRWSLEICNGMAYLTEKHVVHADLATRNVLLNFNKEAKICDFGLSRRMYNYTNYVKTGQEPLPWKWMAPEALRYMKFNEKTDVWSFGVTLWEIYSLGSSPYPGLSWDLNFPQLLERGFRLAEPEYVEREMYQIMQNCWKTDPVQRPNFSNIYSVMLETDVE